MKDPEENITCKIKMNSSTSKNLQGQYFLRTGKESGFKLANLITSLL